MKEITRSTPLRPIERLEKTGIDDICNAIINGDTLTTIAKTHQMALSTLLRWIEADANRSLKIREARLIASQLWEEKALDALNEATDWFELNKARELSTHYRWRATRIAPKEHNDPKQEENQKEKLIHKLVIEIIHSTLKTP